MYKWPWWMYLQFLKCFLQICVHKNVIEESCVLCPFQLFLSIVQPLLYLLLCLCSSVAQAMLIDLQQLQQLPWQEFYTVQFRNWYSYVKGNSVKEHKKRAKFETTVSIVTYNNNKQADPNNPRNMHIPGKETLRECPNIFPLVSKNQHRLSNFYNLKTHEKWRLFFSKTLKIHPKETGAVDLHKTPCCIYHNI